MKKFHLFLALITLVAFTSCDRIEDGAYSPKEKISKVYYEDWDGEKKLNAIWNWDGKQLQSSNIIGTTRLIILNIIPTTKTEE